MPRKSSHEVRAVNRIRTLLRNHPALFEGRPFQIPYPFVGAGWLSIADEMCRGIETILGVAAPRFRAIQSKEKWGSLRFYWRLEPALGEDLERDSAFTLDLLGTRLDATRPGEPGTETTATPAGVRFEMLPSGELRRAVHARVRHAEVAAETACMWCGAPGTYWTTGWVHVACKRHRRPNALTLDEFRRRLDERRAEAKGDA